MGHDIKIMDIKDKVESIAQEVLQTTRSATNN